MDQVKAYALEKFAGDESAQEAFMEAFVKEAAMGMPGGGRGGNVNNSNGFGGQDITGNMGNEFGKAIAGGMAGALMTAGVSAVGLLARKAKDNANETRFLASLEHVISTNPIVRQAPKEEVMSYAQTIMRFAPHVAMDPNLLSSVLANAVHGSGVDPMMVKTLADISQRHGEAQSFSPKAYL